MSGPCGYLGACKCHRSRVSDSAGLDVADGLLGAMGTSIAVERDSRLTGYISSRTTEEQ